MIPIPICMHAQLQKAIEKMSDNVVWASLFLKPAMRANLVNVYGPNPTGTTLYPFFIQEYTVFTS